MVFVLEAIIYAGLVGLVFALIPRFLSHTGIFKKLGKTNVGTFVAKQLGSNEPSVLLLNYFRVCFFLLMAWIMVSGFAVEVTQYEIHKPIIEQMEKCHNDIVASQVELGKWEISCRIDPLAQLLLFEKNKTYSTSEININQSVL